MTTWCIGLDYNSIPLGHPPLPKLNLQKSPILESPRALIDAILTFCRQFERHRQCRMPPPRSLVFVEQIETKSALRAGGHQPRALWYRRRYPHYRALTFFDAFYDRGSTFRLKYSLDDGVPQPKTRRNANLVSIHYVLVCLVPEIIHGDAILFWLNSVFA